MIMQIVLSSLCPRERAGVHTSSQLDVINSSPNSKTDNPTALEPVW